MTAVLFAILPDVKAKSIVEYEPLCGFAQVGNPYGVNRITSSCPSRIFSSALPLPFLFPQPHQIPEWALKSPTIKNSSVGFMAFFY